MRLGGDHSQEWSHKGGLAVFASVSAIRKFFVNYSKNLWFDALYLLFLVEIYEVCDLLQCDTRLLVSALKQRTVDTGGEKVRTDLSASEVKDCSQWTFTFNKACNTTNGTQIHLCVSLIVWIFLKYNPKPYSSKVELLLFDHLVYKRRGGL